MRSRLSILAAALLASAALAAQETPQIKIPDPQVPQVMTLEGKFVRAAYNNEAYVILGYQVANRSVGDKYMMIEMGTTVRDNTPEYKLKRDAISISTPDNKIIPLMSQEDYLQGDMRAIEMRARVQRDSINYFPPMANQACRIGFFSEPNTRTMSWEEVAVSNRRACVGRLFFELPDGIAYGQYFLNVKFENSLIRVPFRILTEEEEKTLGKNFGNIQKQVKEAFKPKKKDTTK